MIRFCVFLCLFFVGHLAWTRTTCADELDPPNLTKADEKLLQKALKDFVFDPKRAQRVLVKVPRRLSPDKKATQTVPGWLVKKPTLRVYFVDGDYLEVTKKDVNGTLNFVKESKARYSSPNPEYFYSPGSPQNDLIDAVWLYRLGHPKLAALALRTARSIYGNKSNAQKKLIDRAMFEDQQRVLFGHAYNVALFAYAKSSDSVALREAQRVLRLYPKLAKTHPQVARLVQELQASEDRGTFGELPRSVPGELKKWSVKEQLSYLTLTMEQVRFLGLLTYDSDVLHHPIMTRLLDIGDPAVPALVDIVEKDQRLCRAIDSRSSLGAGAVVSVRQLAFVALKAILG